MSEPWFDGRGAEAPACGVEMVAMTGPVVRFPWSERMTIAEKYGHADLSNDDLEARIAGDLYELADRLRSTDATVIGTLLWRQMGQIREAYRTARLLIGDAASQQPHGQKLPCGHLRSDLTSDSHSTFCAVCAVSGGTPRASHTAKRAPPRER